MTEIKNNEIKPWDW